MHNQSEGKYGNLSIDLCLLILAAAFVYFLLFKFPFYPIYSEFDQVLYLHDADLMMRGEYMYRDFFQFTFPGIQTLWVLLFSIFGTWYWILPAAMFFLALATFWTLLLSSKMVVEGAYAYIAPVLFIFFGYRYFGIDGSHRLFAHLFVLLSIFVLLKATSNRRLIVAGVLCALASFFTQHRGMIAVSALCIFVVIETYYLGWKWLSAFRKCLILGVSFFLSLTTLCSYFIITAGFGTFISSTFTYPFKYYGYGEFNRAGDFSIGILTALEHPTVGQLLSLLPTFFYVFTIPLSVLAFAVIFFLAKKKHDWEYWRRVVLIAVVSALSLLTTFNPSPGRFYQMSAPFLILFGWLLWYFDVFGKYRKIAVSAMAGLLVSYSATQAYRAQNAWNFVEIDSPRGRVFAYDTEAIERYLWLEQHTRPGDTFYEAYEPLTAFLMDLRVPTRYPQVFPTDYTRPEFVAQVIRDLRNDPPRYIFWEGTNSKSEAERNRGDHLQPLFEFLKEEYRPTGEIWHLPNRNLTREAWVRKDSAPDR